MTLGQVPPGPTPGGQLGEDGAVVAAGQACTDTDRTAMRRSTSTWSMVTGGIGSPSYGPQVPASPAPAGVGGVDVPGGEQGAQRGVVEGGVEVAGQDPQPPVRGGRRLRRAGRSASPATWSTAYGAAGCADSTRTGGAPGTATVPYAWRSPSRPGCAAPRRR